jgi:hypothetical protein
MMLLQSEDAWSANAGMLAFLIYSILFGEPWMVAFWKERSTDCLDPSPQLYSPTTFPLMDYQCYCKEAGVILTWHPFALFIILFLLFGLTTFLINTLTVRRFDHYPKSNQTPRVSVLVPARNEARNIKTCLSSILSQDYPDFEVIVLDDHSTDKTLEILRCLKR